MKKSCIIALCLSMIAASAFAIDRGARMIDTVSLDLMNLDDADGVGVSVWGENVLGDPSEKWSILVGGGLGKISPDTEEEIQTPTGTRLSKVSNVDYWLLGIGLKYYITGDTSVSAVGSYSQFDNDSERDVKTASLIAKHRLAPVEEPVSPFAKGSISWRDRSSFSDAGTTGSISDFVVTIGGGVEFRMADNFSFVFEAAYVESDTSDDDAEDLDGVLASIAMQYYFEAKRP